MTSSRRLGHAWVALTLALACHVVDEALTDFLSIYNPIVESLRARFKWFPMPTFTFGIWLTGLCLAVMMLLLLARPAYRGAFAVRIAAYPFAAVMFLNGIGHLMGSVYFGRWMPGTTTAPLLLLGSVWLFWSSLTSQPEAGRLESRQA